MGIFNKKSTKAKPIGDGLSLSGKLPEGFDPSDQTQVKALVESALKEAGVLPPEATLEGMNIVKVGAGEEPPKELMEMLKQAISDKPSKGGGGRKQYGSLKEVITAFNAMKNDPPQVIPAPADPAKAAFVTALNCLHKQTHALGPMVADLYQAFECLELSHKASNPSAKDKHHFKGFEKRLIAMIEKMSQFGCEVCEVAELTANAGIPGPDSPAVVN